jgi:hypothetical protein
MNPGQWLEHAQHASENRFDGFSGTDECNGKFRAARGSRLPPGTKESKSVFSERNGAVSIEAENFQKRVPAGGFGWRVIKGLGKTGDAVTVSPSKARTFTDLKATQPALEYQVDIEKSGDFSANFYLIPTQPLVPGHGLRIAFSIDAGERKIVVVDKGNRKFHRGKWARNILDQTTVGGPRSTSRRVATRCGSSPPITGVVLVKIVIASGRSAAKLFWTGRNALRTDQR